METMTTTEPKKTKTTDTARTLADRESETAKARRALEDAQRDEATAADAYAEQMSEPRMTAWRSATEKRETAARQLEAHEARERRAREAHEAAVRDQLRAELAQAEREADADATIAKVAAHVVDYAIEVDREGAKRIASARLAVRAQKEAVARARSLAEKLGVTTMVDDVHLDDVRVIAGVSVARQRMADGRDGSPGIEVFLAPVSAAGERCDENQYARASAFVASKEPS